MLRKQIWSWWREPWRTWWTTSTGRRRKPWEPEREWGSSAPGRAGTELNAILNYRGGSLEGSKLYVTLFPCNECAKAIIQAGIRTIIYESDKYADTPATRASKRMLNAAGVRYYQYSPTGRKIEYYV